jgi:hypothetical protein
MAALRAIAWRPPVGLGALRASTWDFKAQGLLPPPLLREGGGAWARCGGGGGAPPPLPFSSTFLYTTTVRAGDSTCMYCERLQ